MNRDLTPGQEERSIEIASHECIPVGGLLNAEIEQQFQSDALFLQAVDEGIGELDRGEFVEDEEVWASLENPRP
jgi:predicted transcriptional regulator